MPSARALSQHRFTASWVFSEADLKSVTASLQNQVPAKRFGDASEIAKAVIFLASDEAKFTVGSELLIDGRLGTL